MSCLQPVFLRSLFSPSGQGAAPAFGQQGVYNNMSITVSVAGGSGGVASVTPMGQPVAMGNSNLSNTGSVCGDQQVRDADARGRRYVCMNICKRVHVSAGAAGAAGAGVCGCPVHRQPGGRRLLPEPGLYGRWGVPEGPGAPDGPGPAEEPPTAAAHRVTPPPAAPAPPPRRLTFVRTDLRFSAMDPWGRGRAWLWEGPVFPAQYFWGKTGAVRRNLSV